MICGVIFRLGTCNFHISNSKWFFRGLCLYRSLFFRRLYFRVRGVWANSQFASDAKYHFDRLCWRGNEVGKVGVISSNEYTGITDLWKIANWKMIARVGSFERALVEWLNLEHGVSVARIRTWVKTIGKIR